MLKVQIFTYDETLHLVELNQVRRVKHIGANGAMLYQYCVPPLAAVFGWMVLGQAFGWLQAAGMLAVAIGVGFAWRSRGQADTRESSLSESCPPAADAAAACFSGRGSPPQVQLGSNQEE